MEPGTPVLSLDWMTSPSCREPGGSWPTKDTVAVGPEAHLPTSFCQPGTAKVPPASGGVHTDTGGGRGGHSQATDWLARCLCGG